MDDDEKLEDDQKMEKEQDESEDEKYEVNNKDIQEEMEDRNAMGDDQKMEKVQDEAEDEVCDKEGMDDDEKLEDEQKKMEAEIDDVEEYDEMENDEKLDKQVGDEQVKQFTQFEREEAKLKETKIVELDSEAEFDEFLETYPKRNLPKIQKKPITQQAKSLPSQQDGSQDASSQNKSQPEAVTHPQSKQHNEISSQEQPITYPVYQQQVIITAKDIFNVKNFCMHFSKFIIELNKSQQEGKIILLAQIYTSL